MSNDVWADVHADFKKLAAIYPFKDAIRTARDWSARLAAIKAYYRQYEKLWGTNYDGRDPYEAGLWDHLTPIEEWLWQDIRSAGHMPMVMQYPVGPYFLDFANPRLKVAIEADGKAFHDPAKDALRDAKLWNEFGWKVYRVSGRECHRILPDPEEFAVSYYDRFGEEPTRRDVDNAAVEYYLHTSTGVVEAIRVLEFGEPATRYRGLMLDTLEEHQLVPFPVGQ